VNTHSNRFYVILGLFVAGVGLLSTGAFAHGGSYDMTLEESLNKHGVKWTSSRPDGHAPIGVMMDHVHGAGEWMYAYRYRTMKMGGLLKGTERVSADEVLNDYNMAPLSMTGRMHMPGFMYAFTDNLTMMISTPYVRKSMTMKRRSDSTTVSQTTSGLGDVKLSAIYRAQQSKGSLGLFNARVSAPTGSTEETNAMGNRLPYPMQLGSGTWDLTLGWTQWYMWPDQTLGAQILGTMPLENENDHGYAVGESVQWTGWWSHQLDQEISSSVRIKALWEGEYDGADPQLNPNMTPAAVPSNQGGKRIDLILGLNTWQSGEEPFPFAGQRFNVEWGFPIYQSLGGPQMEVDSTLTLGWQW
jgi:hypothetical protein